MPALMAATSTKKTPLRRDDREVGATDIIPSHANMARCQPCELRATLSFLGQYVPRKRVERTRTNMSVGRCHEADERSAFRNPAAAHGRGHRNPGRPCERGAGQDGPRRTRAGRDAQGPAAPLRALLPGPSRYQDTPLPIGFDKTISQPFIVALMTDLLGPEPHDSILEVG